MSVIPVSTWIFIGLGIATIAVYVAVVVIKVVPRVVMRELSGPDRAEVDRMLEDHEARLVELEVLQARVAELENRIEFAERMLPKPAERPQETQEAT